MEHGHQVFVVHVYDRIVKPLDQVLLFNDHVTLDDGVHSDQNDKVSVEDVSAKLIEEMDQTE